MFGGPLLPVSGFGDHHSEAVTFPTPYTVGWHTHSEGTADAHNNPVSVYTPALNATGTQVAVMGWAPAGSPGLSVEPNEARVIHDIDLLVPPGVTGGPKDVVDLPDGQFEVVGWPDDWTKGPFGFQPGKVVKLKRTQS